MRLALKSPDSFQIYQSSYATVSVQFCVLCTRFSAQAAVHITTSDNWDLLSVAWCLLLCAEKGALYGGDTGGSPTALR